jgi:GNAT superfamily N-acetyltransferase
MSEPPPPSLSLVPWSDPETAALRDAQQAELAVRYAGVEDIEHVLPPEEMVATVLVRVGGTAAGCGSLRESQELGDGVGELKRMYVAPAFRGRGLSRLILGALEGIAVGRGLHRLILETGVQQPEAIGLYLSAGYTQIANFGLYAHEPGSRCFAREIGAPRVGASPATGTEHPTGRS